MVARALFKASGARLPGEWAVIAVCEKRVPVERWRDAAKSIVERLGMSIVSTIVSLQVRTEKRWGIFGGWKYDFSWAPRGCRFTCIGSSWEEMWRVLYGRSSLRSLVLNSCAKFMDMYEERTFGGGLAHDKSEEY